MKKSKYQINQETILIDRLTQKSIDAFLFAIEIINKPSIRYRSENFTFNICNAWELLLKAQIVKTYGEDSIYFKDNKTRTIGLKECVDLVFTDYSNPIKKNLEIIRRLRNQSTHLITPDYDDLYVQFFQANILYYVNHIKDVFQININDYMPSNFLTLASNTKFLSNVKATSKLDKATFNHFVQERKNLVRSLSNEGIAVCFDINLKSVKSNPDLTFSINGDSDIAVQFINRYLDPNNSHPYRQIDIINIINQEFGIKTLNQYSFRAVRWYEKIEENESFFYYHVKSNTKMYSQKVLDLIHTNISSVPNYIENAIKEFKKK